MQAEVAIVGGGVAGLSAARFLDRAGVSAVIFDHDKSIVRKAQLNNFPGIESTGGPTFLERLREEVGPAIRIVPEKVSYIEPTDDGFRVASDNSSVDSRFVILASGSTPFDPSSAGLDRTEGRQPYVKYNIGCDRDFETSVPGLFVVGILAGVPSQTVICAGSGATAAIAIASRIKGEFWVDHDDFEE